MSQPWSLESDGHVRSIRVATECEFLGESVLPSAEAMNRRITEMRLEIEEAAHSIRVLLALTRLSLEALD